MEFVPIKFCEGVFSVFQYTVLSQNKSTIRSKVWSSATANIFKKMVLLDVYLNCEEGEWKYSLIQKQKGSEDRSIPFEELKRSTKRYLQVGSMFVGFPRGRATKPTTLDEILDILQFTSPFFYRSSLEVVSHPGISQEDLTRILLFCGGIRWSVLRLTNTKPVEQFLQDQLKSNDSVSKLYLHVGGWSEDVCLELEEYATSKPLQVLSLYGICSPSLSTRAFFDRMFQKRLFGPKFQFWGEFSFDFKDLEGFKADTRDHFAESCYPKKFREYDVKTVIWKREDGVQVVAHDLCHENGQHAHSIDYYGSQ